MGALLESNQDYLLFISGLAFVVLGISARRFAVLENQSAWYWLGWSGFLRGISAWLEMIVSSDVRRDLLIVVVEPLLLSLSAVFLIEFARSLSALLSGKPTGRWVHLPLLVAVGATSFFSQKGALAWAPLLLNPIGGLWAAWLIWSYHRPLAKPERWWWMIAAPIFLAGISGITVCLLTSTIFSWTVVDEASAPKTSYALTLAGTVLACLAAWTLNRCFSLRAQRLLPPERISAWRRRRRSWMITAAATVAGGWGAAEMVGHRFEAAMRSSVLARCELAAAAVNPTFIRTLDWSERDLENPDYQQLKALMISLVKANSDLRFVLLSAVRDNRCYFLVDSEPPGSPDYSPPGQFYDEADPAYLSAFAARRPFVLGPIRDRWGIWVSGSVPKVELGEGRGSVNVDIDIDANNWNAAIRRERLPVAIITLLIVSLLFLSFHAQERIREQLDRLVLSEQRNATLIEGSPNCVQILDLEGRCISINQTGLVALGSSSSALVGRPFVDLWPAAARPTVEHAVRESALGKPARFEADFLRPDRRSVTWSVTTNPVRDSAGRVQSLVCICTDTTERKNTERAIMAAKEAAEAATEAKSQFLAVMSHEIRTPLGGVIGLLNHLLSQTQSALQRRHTEMAADSAETLLRILDDILDAAKVESGQLTIESIPFSPRVEFSRVLEGMRVHAESKGIEFSFFFSPTLAASLLGDPTRLRQVLANLLSNAIKFTPEGRVHVVITTDPGDLAGVARLSVAVSDTGIGMTTEVRQRIFEKFAQADASTTRQFGGTGLGLSIVKGLGERMGGTVSLESQPGVGSTFTFVVPLPLSTEKELPAQEKPKPARLLRPSAPLRLLCAEDDEINREIAANFAAEWGHSIEFAHNGREAIEQLRIVPFDAVLMDNRMPVMDGFQTTRLIRDPGTGVRDPNIHIIAVTANASEKNRKECLAAGMNDYLTKPMRALDLHVALERAIAALRERGLKPLSEVADISPPLDSARQIPAGVSEDELLMAIEFQSAPLENSCRGLGPEAMKTIFSLYFFESPKRVSEMKEALLKGDFVSLARAAHSLKSNSAYVQAETVAGLAAEIEQCSDRCEAADRLAMLIGSLERALYEAEGRRHIIIHAAT